MQQQAQEAAAEEMLGLTRALKEQTIVAGEIIRKDVTALEGTSDLAEKNTARLAEESARLAEHTKTSCRCWVWFIMLIVTVTFIGKDTSTLCGGNSYNGKMYLSFLFQQWSW